MAKFIEYNFEPIIEGHTHDGATIETTPKTATMPTSPGVSITINRISR